MITSTMLYDYLLVTEGTIPIVGVGIDDVKLRKVHISARRTRIALRAGAFVAARAYCAIRYLPRAQPRPSSAVIT